MQLVFFVFSSKDDRGRPKNDCHTHTNRSGKFQAFRICAEPGQKESTFHEHEEDQNPEQHGRGRPQLSMHTKQTNSFGTTTQPPLCKYSQ